MSGTADSLQKLTKSNNKIAINKSAYNTLAETDAESNLMKTSQSIVIQKAPF